MKAIAATAILACAGAAQAQTGAYDAAALNDRAAVAYDAGDTVLAAVLWRLSGKAGSADAMANYAALREAGVGVVADPADALRWYARAARRGDAHAMTRIADQVFAKDPDRAKALYAQAAALGHPYATHRLAHPPGEDDQIFSGGLGEKP